MFSGRTEWEATPNELTEILNSLRSSGRRIIDLTVSNPTACGFPYPQDRILRALSSPESLTYSPDPRGLLSAREAVAAYYRERGRVIPAEDIFITASTSESYSLLFRLLCDPGDTVLVPRPSYPLFDFLSGINDVRTESYRLVYDGRWKIDIDSVRHGLSGSPHAIVVVDPHNPTGSVVSDETWREVLSAVSRSGTAIIVDEVFRDYVGSGVVKSGPPATGPWLPGGPAGHGRARENAPLTFILNGLSKAACLPQMKVGWIVVSGEGTAAKEAKSRLEILNDTYLSANTPAQCALAELLAAGDSVRPNIIERLSGNYENLRSLLANMPGCTVYHSEGGWNAIVSLPGRISDAECAKDLLRREGVYCYPGYFFDFEEDNRLILSLLVPREEFTEGVTILRKWIGERYGGVSTSGDVSHSRL